MGLEMGDPIWGGSEKGLNPIPTQVQDTPQGLETGDPIWGGNTGAYPIPPHPNGAKSGGPYPFGMGVSGILTPLPTYLWDPCGGSAPGEGRGGARGRTPSPRRCRQAAEWGGVGCCGEWEGKGGGGRAGGGEGGGGRCARGGPGMG